MQTSLFLKAATMIVVGLLLGSGCKPKQPKARDYSKADVLSIELGKVNREYGLRQTKRYKDGATTPASVGGRECHHLKRTGTAGLYIYFIVDPSFKTTNWMDVTVTVEYFDATQGSFYVEYDGHDRNAKGAGAYTPTSKRVIQKGTRTWETETFELKNARFQNGQNDNADFRVRVQTPEFFVSRVTVSRIE